MTDVDPFATDRPPVLLPPRLLARLGERCADEAHQARQALAGDPAAAAARLAALEALGVRLQQVARMVAHEGRAPDEPVELVTACRQAAAACAAEASARGVAVQVDGRPLTVSTAAAVVEQVLELALEHALAVGHRVVVGVGRAGQPAVATVRIDIHRRPDPAQAGLALLDEAPPLPLMLAGLLARAGGLVLRQTRLGPLQALLLSVPSHVVEAVVHPDEQELLPSTPVARGGRVLVVDPRDRSRLQAHALLQRAGLVVDAASSLAQARALGGDAAPDVVLSGLPRGEPGWLDWVEELRALRPALRVIELVDEDHAFAFSLPSADAPGRLSRGELAEHLVAAVSQEIQSALRG
ncbi:hypothetical protein [Piscinibacter sakaiensis]|uniref:Response regulatory domain-containing protein n=1 Tax=Piscinibacter sakaiensis TaxID=1547922 RepID=A0A0K8P0B3_PISS1|nr:hypothetical protein [Piscinibacter sakaiensis]GAP35610.1 hypothetical protein ISF6_1383 [Piscinibacter sakaiensis]